MFLGSPCAYLGICVNVWKQLEQFTVIGDGESDTLANEETCTTESHLGHLQGNKNLYICKKDTVSHILYTIYKYYICMHKLVGWIPKPRQFFKPSAMPQFY